MLQKWLKRNIDSRPVEDSHAIDNVQYNSMSGAQKNVNVGPALEYVSDLSAVVDVARGDQLYIFNTGALAYVTMGDSSFAGPVGTAPAADTFPCLPNQFTVYSAADYVKVIGSAGLHLYILRDESRARKETRDR